MANGTTSEREVCVCENGNDPDAVDAVDIRDDLIVSVASGLGNRAMEGHTRCMVRSQFSSMNA